MRNCFLILLLFKLTGSTFGQVTKQDQQIVIQMSIDLEELQDFFHFDKSNPLIIYDNDVIPNSLMLFKFEKQVSFMTKEDLFFNNKQAHLSFLNFEITPTEAKIEFSYDFEGLYINLNFYKENEVWKLKSKELIEH